MTNLTLETIARAYTWLTHDPERRAAAIMAEITETENAIKSYPALQGAELLGAVLDRCETLYSRWIAATGRCASPAITGPAKFPVERNRKALAAADKHAARLGEFLGGWRDYVDKKTAQPVDALAEAQEALRVALVKHAALKADPALRRHAYELQYANLAVKRAKKRLHAVESQVVGRVTSLGRFTVSSAGAVDSPVGFEVKENRQVMRYQIYFDNKPPVDIIARLKRLNFKWSPRFGCWQNFLSNNGYQRLKEFLKDYE